jgi:hypothetical protein
MKRWTWIATKIKQQMSQEETAGIKLEALNFNGVERINKGLKNVFLIMIGKSMSTIKGGLIRDDTKVL